MSATQALVRAVTFRNVSDAPATAPRTARFVLNDGDGGTSNAATRAITVAAVNDVPVLANIEPAALAYTENGATTPVTTALTVADLDSNITGATVTIGDGFAGAAQDILSFTTQNGITGDYVGGVLTLTGTTSAANYQTALRSVTYHNASEDPTTDTREVTFQVQDGPGTGEPQQHAVARHHRHGGQRRAGGGRRDVQRRQRRDRQHGAGGQRSPTTVRPR